MKKKEERKKERKKREKASLELVLKSNLLTNLNFKPKSFEIEPLNKPQLQTQTSASELDLDKQDQTNIDSGNSVIFGLGQHVSEHKN